LSCRIDFEVPRLSWLIQVYDDFLIWQPQLFEGDVRAMSPRTTVVRVECDFGSITVDVRHFDANIDALKSR